MKTNEALLATEPALQTRDILWKGMMEDLFADFLCFFFKNADLIFDIERGFEFMDKELHEITPGETIQHPRFVDKLVKAWYKDGTESWLLIHIEVQGYRDTNFPERMFTYFYRIRDRYKRDVTSLTIFTDQDEKYHPDKYEYHCCGTSLTYCFNTYKVKTQSVDLLEQSDNPFAVVILTILTALKQNDEGHDHLVESFLGLIRRLLNRQLPKDKIARLVAFIKRYVHLGNSPLFNKFEEEIKLLTENPAYMGIFEQVLQIDTEEAEKRGAISGRLIGIEEGIVKGKAEGIVEGKAQIVTNLLANTDFDIQTIASLAGESIDFVIQIKNQLP